VRIADLSSMMSVVVLQPFRVTSWDDERSYGVLVWLSIAMDLPDMFVQKKRPDYYELVQMLCRTACSSPTCYPLRRNLVLAESPQPTDTVWRYNIR
jgi:hypothetical protein